MKEKDKKIAGADKVKMSSVGLQTDLQLKIKQNDEMLDDLRR